VKYLGLNDCNSYFLFLYFGYSNTKRSGLIHNTLLQRIMNPTKINLTIDELQTTKEERNKNRGRIKQGAEMSYDTNKF